MQPQPKLVAFAAIPAFFCKRKSWIDGMERIRSRSRKELVKVNRIHKV